jgi:hypothetical protein
VAAYVSPKDEAAVVTRQGYTAKSYKLPYIKEKMITTAEDAIQKAFGDNIYGGMSPAQRVQDQLARDLMYLDERIARAEEVQASQALFSGEVTVKNGDKINFGVDASHLVTLTGNDLWSATTTSKPLAKLREWRRLIIKDSGLNPDFLIFSHEAIDSFLAHPEVADGKGAISAIKVDRGQIIPQNLPDGVTYWGYLRDVGCDVYSYDEVYLDANNAEQRMVPTKKVLMGSTRARMDRVYGLIQDLKALYSVDRFSKSWEEEDPSARFLMMQSAPLMIPTDVDSFISATVL